MLSGFCIECLDYYSALWCSAADTHLEIFDCVLTSQYSGSFLAAGAHFSVELPIGDQLQHVVYYIVYTIRSIPLHLFVVNSLCLLCQCMRVTRGALLAHRYSRATSRTEGFSCLILYLYGTKMMTPCSVV